MGKKFTRSSAPSIATKSMTYSFLVERSMMGPNTVKPESKRRLPSTDVTHLYKGKSLPLVGKTGYIPPIKWYKVDVKSIKAHKPTYTKLMTTKCAIG